MRSGCSRRRSKLAVGSALNQPRLDHHATAERNLASSRSQVAGGGRQELHSLLWWHPPDEGASGPSRDAYKAVMGRMFRKDHAGGGLVSHNR